MRANDNKHEVFKGREEEIGSALAFALFTMEEGDLGIMEVLYDDIVSKLELPKLQIDFITIQAHKSDIKRLQKLEEMSENIQNNNIIMLLKL